ncbi:MAG TPA: hypothetical protein VGJ21_10945 [Terracidiphilus sp.]|jgi:hypothetical protein
MKTIKKSRVSVGGRCCCIGISALLSLSVNIGASAQQDEVRATSTAAAVIPQQMKYAGAAANRAGDTVEAVFRIYASPQGGEPLWSETQRIAVDAGGKFSVLLGSATQGGLPQALFAGGQARWLGVSIERAEEQSRSPLTSVAYAMKAGDSETLGGVPARKFVTQEQLAVLARAVAAEAQPAVLPQLSPSGTGTANYLPIWTSANTLGDSGLYQAAGSFGIGTTTPANGLDVFSGDITVGGFIPHFPTTPLGSANINQMSSVSLLRMSLLDGSGRFNMFWNAYNDHAGNKYYASGEPSTKWNIGGGGGLGGTAVYVAPSGTAGNLITWNTVFVANSAGDTSLANHAMFLKAGGNVGVNTTSPTARLEVNGTAKFDGLVSFAATQTFPGTGKITAITTTSPLTGGGTTGSVALGLNTTALETTLDTRYARLGVSNTFTGFGQFSGYVQGQQTGGPGFAAVLGRGTNGSVGTYGNSDSGFGVQGRATSGQGVYGLTTNPTAATVSGEMASSGVLGATGSILSSTYAAESSVAYAGVWADTSASGSGVPVALFATADTGYGVVTVNNSADFPALFVANNTGAGGTISAVAGDGLEVSSSAGNGVYGLATTANHQAGVLGINHTASVTQSTYAMYGGVWGDTGVDSSTIAPTWAVGVVGTADNSHAGVFLNESDNYATLYIRNYGSAGVGNVKGNPLFSTLMAESPEGTCGVGGGNMSCTGQIKSLVPSSGGARTVETYAMQSPENWMEDFGSGVLHNGVAVVHIDSGFGETISGDSSYHVFLTPNGDSKGLYVIAKTATSFEVRESGGGTSSLSFDYRIVGKRRGFEAQRLSDVTATMAAANTHSQLMRSVNAQKQVVRKPSPLALALKQPHRRVVAPQAPRGSGNASVTPAAAHK